MGLKKNFIGPVKNIPLLDPLSKPSSLEGLGLGLARGQAKVPGDSPGTGGRAGEVTPYFWMNDDADLNPMSNQFLPLKSSPMRTYRFPKCT